MIFSAPETDSIHALWDELADFEAASVTASRDHLLHGLCRLIGAKNAAWIGAVRMGQAADHDPLNGWRPRLIHFLHPTQHLSSAAREQSDGIDAGMIDETTIRNGAFSGAYRVNRLVDLVPRSWFEGAYYRTYYQALGFHDAIWAGVPINKDAEIYIGLFRSGPGLSYTEAERDRVGYALRGLRWFHRQQMLGHGLFAAASPLTQTERAVLQGLLRGNPEKTIAAALGHSSHTTHEYIVRIYRKYGVNSRAELMSLWLGRSQ